MRWRAIHRPNAIQPTASAVCEWPHCAAYLTVHSPLPDVFPEQAEYFNGDFEFHKHAIANTGKKTLSYADATRYFQTVFNYSENQAIQELSQIFRGISATLQHGRKLQFLRRFDRLGMEEELKAAEANAESHSLAELQLIAPLLESIANDSGILNIARQRAKRLLAQSGVQ